MRVGLTLACYPELDKAWSYVPPLGLGSLAAYTRQEQPDVEIVIERDHDRLLEHKPDVIGMTFVSFNASYAARAAARFKQALGCAVVVGGPHVSTLHGVLDPAFDLAVLGEGEETFLELVRLYRDTGRFDPRDLAKVRGIAFHNPDGPGVIETPQRPPIQELDRLPFPDRREIQRQWSLEQDGLTNILTSRGCPYDCAFCSTIQHWGRKYRYPSNKYVVDEIEFLVEHHDPAEILIFDDLYNVRKDRVVAISKLVRERGLHEGNRFRAFVRANLMDDETAEAMRAMNIEVLNVGFESGSTAVLEKLKKRGCDSEDNLRALELGRKHGLRYTSCFILGTPGETRDDIVSTFHFVLANADEFEDVQFAPLQVLPATDVWHWAKRVGIDEHNLTGIVLEPEDVADEMRFLQTRWPYLNEEIIPREEFLTYIRIGRQVEELIRRNTQTRHLPDAPAVPPISDAAYVAENVPIASILREKAKRRIRRLMPSATVDLQQTNQS